MSVWLTQGEVKNSKIKLSQLEESQLQADKDKESYKTQFRRSERQVGLYHTFAYMSSVAHTEKCKSQCDTRGYKKGARCY